MYTKQGETLRQRYIKHSDIRIAIVVSCLGMAAFVACVLQVMANSH